MVQLVLRLFENLKQLRLPRNDFAIFGSGPLIVRGIISPTNDLDVICRGAAWTKVQQIGSLQFNDEYDLEIITLFGGQVTFGNRWGIGEFNIDELIDDAEFIEGLPFVKLKYVVDYKLIRQSEKDFRHIASLKKSKYFVLVGEDD